MPAALRDPVRLVRRTWRRGLAWRPGGGPETFRATHRDRVAVVDRCDEIASEIEHLEGLIVSVPVALERRRCLFRDMLPPPDSAAGGVSGADPHAFLHQRRRQRLSRSRRRMQSRRRLAAIVASGVLLAGLVLVAAGVYYLIATRV